MDASAAEPAIHPRLFFSAEELPAIRARLEREPYASMLQSLIDLRNRGDFFRYTNESDAGSVLMRARSSAQLYALTEDEAYAVDAREDVLAAFALIGANWATSSTFGLTLYARATHLGIIYDLCSTSEAWDAVLNDDVSARLVEIATVIVNHGGTSQANDAGSNWQANRGASAALALLATDHPFDPALATSAHNRVVNYLNRNAGFRDSRGWNPEGFGYTAYAIGSFVGPYAVAIARADSSLDLRSTSRLQWKAWTGFAGTSTAMDVYGTGGVKTDWGNDNAHVGGEGIYGLSFFFSPETFQGALRHAYDRFMGHLAPHGGHWDSVRHGTFWSILFYPEDIAPQDPLENWDWHRASDDANGLGVFTFRNAYAGPEDILAQFKTRNYALGQAHNGPDGLGFRIIGAGTPFVIGGGRNQPANRRNQPTVYPGNPNTHNSSNNIVGSVVGTPLIKADGGGHAIGYMATSSVETYGHKRWFVTDYDENATGAEATFVIADTTNGGRFWQIPTFLNNIVTTAGNTFTITGENGATLRGTILHPAGTPVITTGTRARGDGYTLSQGGSLDTENSVTNPRILENRYLFFEGGSDGAFLVVMTLQTSGAHPEVEHLSGGVANATVRVGTRTYTLQEENVLYDGVPYAPPPATITFHTGTQGTVLSGDPVQMVAYGAAAEAPVVEGVGGATFLGWDRPFSAAVRDMTVNAVFDSVEATPGSYAAWIAGRGLSASEQDPLANPARDGIANLLKYALGLQPEETVSGDIIKVIENAGTIVFRYHLSNDAPQAVVTPLVSNDGIEWSPAAAETVQLVETTASHAVYEISFDATPGSVLVRLLVDLESSERFPPSAFRLKMVPEGGFEPPTKGL